MHSLLGAAGLLALITFAFGKRAAVFCVRLVLILCMAFFVYVAYRIVSGTI